MALQKTNYIDDQTVISAKNLNDIQDAVIALEARKVNGKPLSSDVSLSANDVGAAPAGYGLGVNSKWVTDRTKINGCGFYQLDPAGGDAPTKDESWWGEALQLSSGVLTFTVTRWDGCTATSKNLGNGWHEWEWVNPPMTVGVEYRTTERWNGKAVWTVAVNAGTTAEGAVGTTTDFTASEIIRFGGKIGPYANPQIYDNLSHTYTTWANVQSNNGKINITFWARSGTVNLPVVIQVWYTKD